jgi:hypothetical protein
MEKSLHFWRLSSKISPLRVAPVEMTIILLESANGSEVDGHLFEIYQYQDVFEYAQTDNRSA